MKRMSADLHNGKIYLEPEGRTKDWLWVFIGELTTIEDSVSDEELGNTVLAILAESRYDVPQPESMEGPGRAALTAGFKSFLPYGREAKSVGITEDENGIEFLPSRRWITRDKGGDLLEDKAICISSRQPEAVGKALRNAFDLCE